MKKMYKQKITDADFWIDLIEDNKWGRYVLYGLGVIVGIWVAGKAALLLSDATINFKSLHRAIKS